VGACARIIFFLLALACLFFFLACVHAGGVCVCVCVKASLFPWLPKQQTNQRKQQTSTLVRCNSPLFIYSLSSEEKKRGHSKRERNAF
jgi:hypothetical protein